MSTTSGINNSVLRSSDLSFIDRGPESSLQLNETGLVKSFVNGSGSSTPFEQNVVDTMVSDFVDGAASDPGQLSAALHQAFGDKASDAQIDQLAARIVSGDIPMPRSVEFVNAGTLGANVSGVYAAGNGGRIYLDGSLLNDPAMLNRVFIEELGHHFDATLGGADSAGDEGAIFAESLHSGALGSARLTTLRSENDAGVMTINGRAVAVEQYSSNGYSGPGSSPGTGGLPAPNPSPGASSVPIYTGPGSSPGTGGLPASNPSPGASSVPIYAGPAPASVIQADGGYTGSDYPWNPGGVVFNPPAPPPAPDPLDSRTQATITFATHFDIFDNPQGGTDNRAHQEDIDELATGDFDVQAVNVRLMDAGVSTDELDETRASIVETAQLIRDDETFRLSLDTAGDGANADPDYRFSRENAEAAMMLATVNSTHPDTIDARRFIIDRAITTDFATTATSVQVEAVLNDRSRLGVLNEREQRTVIHAALDAWSPGEVGIYTPGLPNNLLLGLSNGNNAPLYELARDQYIARSVALVNREPSGELWPIDNAPRQEAATLAGSVLYSVYQDEAATRALFSEIDESTALALVDALALDRTDRVFNASSYTLDPILRANVAFVAVGQFETSAASPAEQAFTRAVFTSLPAGTMRGVGESYISAYHSQVGFALTADLATTPAARQVEASRIANILDTEQGQALLAFNENIAPHQRATALELVRENSLWTAETFTVTDDVWTNPIVMEAFARPRAQAYLEHRGNAPIVLTGSALENQIGTAMGLSPDAYPADESAADISAREQAVARGEISYFEGEESATIITAVAEEIRAVGGDDPAVTIVPVQFSSSHAGVQELVIFRVVDENDPSRSVFVDATGAYFESIQSWRNNNELPPGFATLPANGQLTQTSMVPGITPARVTLESDVTHSTVDTWQEHSLVWLDRGVAAGTVVAGGAILIGSGGTAAPLVLTAGAAYGATRAGTRLVDRYTHHRPLGLNDPGARRDWLDLGLNVVGVGSGAALARSAQLARSSNPLANLSQWTTIASRTNQVGSALDLASAANDSYALIANWNQLDGNQRASLALNIAFWSGASLAQHRIGQSTSSNAADPSGLYDPQSLRYQWLETHQANNWPNSPGLAEYRWTDTTPPIRAGHTIEGHIRYTGAGNPQGSFPGTGYHHRANGVDAEWRRTTPTSTVDRNGLYQGSVEFWDPVSQSWLPKKSDSTFFPDHFTEAQVQQAILEAYVDAGSPGASNSQFTGSTSFGFEVNFRMGPVDQTINNVTVSVPSITSAYPVYTP